MTLLRTIAILIALGGVLDPAFTLSRPAPAPVRLHSDPADPDAVDAVTRLRAAVTKRVELVDHGDAVAHVVVGGARPEAAAFSKPISLVTLDEGPGVEIVSAPSAVHVPVNGNAAIDVTIRARGLAGQSSVVVLEDSGMELARAEHRWTGDESATVRLPYLALSAGARRLTATVEPAKGERRLFDNRVDVLAMAEAREGRVAVIEPRPSWPAGFLRRALENDPSFRVASILRTSPDVATRAGEAPHAITLEQLIPFDVVVVGAPEELRAPEVDALRRFADLRGGTVVLLPDRRPSGAYTDLLPGAATEQLLAEPRVLEPAGIPASEIVSFPTAKGVRPLASLNGTPVIVSWPAGDGRVLFSGALDAWRYRADPRSRALEFWRDAIMTAALAAPPRVKIEMEPAVVRSGSAAKVVVRVRPTELVGSAAVREGGSFSVEAHSTSPQGRDGIVRLHPTMEPGTLEGSIPTSEAGVYGVVVSLATGARGEVSFVARDDASAVANSDYGLERVPELTGGVAAPSSDVSPVVQHLLEIPRLSRRVTVHPMHSAWWMVAFAAMLCAEWTMRRRSGLR